MIFGRHIEAAAPVSVPQPPMASPDKEENGRRPRPA
jgi:hypothetical protein